MVGAALFPHAQSFMNRYLKPVGGLLLLLGVVSAGCGERTTPTQAIPSQSPRYSTSSSLTEVLVLGRPSPLESAVTVTRAIGKNGGSIEIPEAGLKVVFPLGAVVPPKGSKTVDITVTAVAGSDVAYAFGPSGLVFEAPVKIEQDLKVTNALKDSSLLSSVEGAFYQQLKGDGTASVSEFRPTSVDVSDSKIKFYVEHFSGYLLAVGRN